MKLPQIQTFVIVTDADWSLGNYEVDVTKTVNEFLLEEQISSKDLIDIKISTSISSEDGETNEYGLYCTVLVIYNKEIKEEYL